MILGLDIGNTTIEIGFIKDLENIKSYKLASDKNKTVDDWLITLFSVFSYSNIDKKEIAISYISSTVPILEDKLAIALKKFLNLEPLVLGQNKKIPIRNRYKKPEEVGIDRLLNAYSGLKLYGKPLIIVDLGTAITFDIVNKFGEYEGGAIFPGIQASIEALFSKTAKLPKVNLKKAENIIGKTTIESIKSGLFYGYISLIEGMIQKISKESRENYTVILTGGNGELFKDKLDVIYDRFLALKGMYLLYLEEKKL